ncbi:hypothetical protein L209DRAFT_229665 [Thermothelomyces heterothallicus CBS 203.75]
MPTALKRTKFSPAPRKSGEVGLQAGPRFSLVRLVPLIPLQCPCSRPCAYGLLSKTWPFYPYSLVLLAHTVQALPSGLPCAFHSEPLQHGALSTRSFRPFHSRPAANGCSFFFFFFTFTLASRGFPICVCYPIPELRAE